MFFTRLILIAILAFLPSLAWAEIKITSWKENIHLNKDGKESKISIIAKAQNLPKNSYHNGFSILFDKKQNITIKKVSFENRTAEYSFLNNKLKIEFPKKKTNNQTFSISYSYTEKEKKIDQYLRQTFISAPPWIEGTNAKITLNIPHYLEVVSLNNKLTKTANKIIYNGKIPKSGITELIKLTPKSSTWNVRVKNLVSANGPLFSLKAKLPVYFHNSGQIVEVNKVKSNPVAISNLRKGDFHLLEYKKSGVSRAQITVNGKIRTGSRNQQIINRTPENYLTLENNSQILLSNIISTIKNDSKYNGLPLYAKIGQFVHDYITYDRSYVGKLLSTQDILTLKTGVCVEYAKLFNELARLAGIPSLIINGAAKGEYDKFEGHSWNMIYYKNKWIQVDPTWNLMSGNVSSSHIYFYDDPQKAVEANWKEKQGGNIKINVNLSTSFKITAQ